MLTREKKLLQFEFNIKAIHSKPLKCNNDGVHYKCLNTLCICGEVICCCNIILKYTREVMHLHIHSTMFTFAND